MRANLLLLIFSVLACLAGTELLFRLFFPPPPVIEVAEVKPLDQDPLNLTLRTSINTGENSLYVMTPAGRRLRPNTTAVVDPHETCGCRAEIRTNSLGFRGPEPGPKSSERVLFIGDSITFADYVKEEESWVSKVGELSSATQRPFETVNGGIYAVGLANELSILVNPGLKVEPDIVVLAVYLNDVENSPGLKFRPAPAFMPWSRVVQVLSRRLTGEVVKDDYGNVPFDVQQQWRENTRKRFPPPSGSPKNDREQFYQAIDNLFFDWGSAFSEEAWLHMQPMFAEFKRLATAHGFKPAIVMFPVADQVYQKELFDFPQQQMSRIAGELEIPYFDLLPDIRRLHQENGGRLFYDWCHYTPYGNLRVAELILSFLNRSVKS